MLDFTKSYGIIVGHSWARYAQGGTLYNSEGKSYDEQSDRAEVSQEDAEAGYQDVMTNAENAREFLTRILEGGPVNRNDIYREAEGLNYRWDNIKTAAAEMKLNCYKIRDNIFWRLPLE
jgi:hypothetical protein